MKDISVILKNNSLVTVEEFRILNKYACPGKMWTLMHRVKQGYPQLITQRTVEYIFDGETLMLFSIVSTNVLAYWDTDQTRNLQVDQTYQINETLYIKPYVKN